MSSTRKRGTLTRFAVVFFVVINAIVTIGVQPSAAGVQPVAAGVQPVAAGVRLAAGGVQSAAGTAATTFQNALYDGADPVVVKEGGYYYFARADGFNKIYIGKSKTLTDPGIMKLVYEFPAGQWNSLEQWGGNGMFRWNGSWYLCYTGDNGDNDNHRLGVLKATTDDPQGPWTDLGQVNTGGDVGNQWLTVPGLCWQLVSDVVGMGYSHEFVPAKHLHCSDGEPVRYRYASQDLHS